MKRAKSKSTGGEDWPEVLKAWRARKGFTQREAAERIGVALRTYEDWERGINKPSLITPKIIISIFSLSED